MRLLERLRGDGAVEKVKRTALALGSRAQSVSDRAQSVAGINIARWDRVRGDIEYAEEVAMRCTGGNP